LAHFYSGFNYADFILNNQIKTGLERLPLNLLLEFEDNRDAENHPLDAQGKVMPGLGVQNKEYGADFSVGQTKNKNDVQFGYAWLRQEQDGDIASFGESDQRTPTNLLQHRIYALWEAAYQYARQLYLLARSRSQFQSGEQRRVDAENDHHGRTAGTLVEPVPV
jgi:hypothetical protein